MAYEQFKNMDGVKHDRPTRARKHDQQSLSSGLAMFGGFGLKRFLTYAAYCYGWFLILTRAYKEDSYGKNCTDQVELSKSVGICVGLF